MERYTTSLEISKRLDKLGVKQESENGLYWFKDIDFICKVAHKKDIRGFTYKYSCRAFLSDELLEILPDIEIKKINNDCIPQKPWVKPFTYYQVIHEKSLGVFAGAKQRNKKLPDALAEMVEYLIENKLMEVK